MVESDGHFAQQLKRYQDLMKQGGMMDTPDSWASPTHEEREANACTLFARLFWWAGGHVGVDRKALLVGQAAL